MALKLVASLPIAAALVSVGLLASPASAASPVGQLTLTLTSATSGGVFGQVTLTCEPTGGTHPHAQAACDDLIPVNGQISRVPPEQGVACAAYYLPVYATATGTRGGVAETYRMEFSNVCVANAETGGSVFHF
jgi:hypothetical protein